MHRRQATRLAVTVALLVLAPIVAADSHDMPDDEAYITVTAPTTFDRMAFDLGGQIWLRRDPNDPAAPLTDSATSDQRPAFSRDGRLIAYESLRSGHRQIFVVNVASGVTRQITFGQYEHWTPAWSNAPAAQPQLTMSSNRGGNFDIWEVNIGDLELRQVTFTTDDEHDPAWNDDGTRLAYVTHTADGSSLYILTPDNKPHRVLQERERISAPSWRPGDRVLTYTRRVGPAHQLRMLLLSTPPISKPITRHEQASPRPVHWLDRSDFLYAADGKIRRRSFGQPGYTEIPFSIMIRIAADGRRRHQFRGVNDPGGAHHQRNRGVTVERSVGKLYNSARR